jgi:hypothetical protein
MYQFLFKLCRQQEYSKFKDRMINDTTRMKCLMFNLLSDCEGLKFEACVNLSIFIENFDSIQNLEMKKLIIKNRKNFLLVIQSVDFTGFDCCCDSGVSQDQLNFLIKQLPCQV